MSRLLSSFLFLYFPEPLTSPFCFSDWVTSPEPPIPPCCIFPFAMADEPGGGVSGLAVPCLIPPLTPSVQGGVGSKSPSHNFSNCAALEKHGSLALCCG